MYSMKDAVVRNLEFMEENLRLKGDVKRFAELNDQLIEENEALRKKVHFYESTDLVHEHSYFVNQCAELQDENDLLREREAKLLKDNEVLRKEIAQMCERSAAYVNDNEAIQAKLTEYDRLHKELDEAKKEAEHAKLMFNIAFSYLDQTGYDVEKLGHIVALRCALEESGLV